MLKIREAQLAVLREAKSRDFEERMARHLIEVFPRHVAAVEPDRVREWIRTGAKQAATYAIRTERDVALFIDLTVGIGPDFADQAPMGWARAILEDQALSGTAKVDLIYRQLPSRKVDS
jgi:hypothetical protein